jgi:hypothetical protein
MASVVPTDLAARQAASEYLQKRHPALAADNLSVLRLQAGWLIETLPSGPAGEAPSERVLLMVNRHGFIEEIGPVLPRQSAHRCLADLRDAGAPGSFRADNYGGGQPQPAR